LGKLTWSRGGRRGLCASCTRLGLSPGARRGSLPRYARSSDHGPCGQSIRLAAIIVRCGSLLGPGRFASPGSREVSVAVRFTRFRRSRPRRIPFAVFGRRPAGLSCTSRGFRRGPRMLTLLVGCRPPHWKSLNQEVPTSGILVASWARITGSSRLTAASNAFRLAAKTTPGDSPTPPAPPRARPLRVERPSMQDT